MRKPLLAASLMSGLAFPALAREPFNPIGDLFDPPKSDIRRVPWTISGGGFYIQAIRDMCQTADRLTRCEVISPGNMDEGYRIYSTETGRMLYVFDRAYAEEIEQDYGAAQTKAEEHYPWSMYVARKEAEKSNLEYIAIACNTGLGAYCGGMAAKIKKYENSIKAACAAGLSICQKWVKDEQTKVQKDIDRVLAACAKSDQACFDAITGGGETAARAQSEMEKSSGGGRPPHTPTSAGRRPKFMPGENGIYVWGVADCEHCTIIEGKEAEDY